jgi:restriction endonuclease S subunit
MAVWAEVTTGQIEYGRLDAQFYQPEFLKRKQMLEKAGYKLRRLGLLAEKIDVGYVGPMTPEYRDQGVLLLRSQNVREFQIDTDKNPIFISETFHWKLRKSQVHPGDILITRSGVAGNVAIVPEDFPVANSADIILVRLRPGIDPLYVVAFINSNFGRFQVQRQVSGGIQGHLNLTIAEDILIPEIPPQLQAEIGEAIEAGLNLATKAKSLYLAAQRILQGELGLDKFDFPHRLGYETRLSEASQARRWDAQHYRPKYKELLDAIRKAPSNHLLKDIATHNQRGLQPEYVSDGPIAVVNSQHIGSQHLAYGQFEKTSEGAFASAPRARILKNDLLVYTTGAYVGRTNVFLEDIRAVASNHVNIIRLRPEYDAAYVALVMNSPVGLLQTEKHATGSTQAELYPSAIARFLIPLLKPKIMTAVGDKVRRSHLALVEAKQLLEQAKRRVEELIEQNTEA